MWSTVGSAGTVDVGDIGKVNFAGSVVQIGFDSKNISFGNLVEHFVAVGTPGAVGSPGAVERFVAADNPGAEAAPATVPLTSPAILNPKAQATIRYGVTTGIGSLLGFLKLTLTLRDGAGQVVATLIEVRTSGSPLGSTPVLETRLLRFDSLDPHDPSIDFRTSFAIAPDTLKNHVLDGDAYYVELLLTPPEVLHPGHGPAVSMLSLLEIS